MVGTARPPGWTGASAPTTFRRVGRPKLRQTCRMSGPIIVLIHGWPVTEYHWRGCSPRNDQTSCRHWWSKKRRFPVSMSPYRSQALRPTRPGTDRSIGLSGWPKHSCPATKMRTSDSSCERARGLSGSRRTRFRNTWRPTGQREFLGRRWRITGRVISTSSACKSSEVAVATFRVWPSAIGLRWVLPSQTACAQWEPILAR